MGEVTCRNYILGDGYPKICVPITGRTEEEILQQSEAICKAASEIAEQGIRPAPVAEIRGEPQHAAEPEAETDREETDPEDDAPTTEAPADDSNREEN